MKKNLRKIPSVILNRIQVAERPSLFVATSAKRYSSNELLEGLLGHLGITFGTTGLIVPTEIIPPSTQGKYSKKNADGYVIIRRDLPKEPFSYTVESPNWGDWSRGSHTNIINRLRYQREQVPAKELTIRIHHTMVEDSHLFAFRIDDQLDPDSAEFEKQLLFNLNLLQENTGICDIDLAANSIEDILNEIYVPWELLPIGTRDDFISGYFRDHTPTQAQRDEVSHRYDVFVSLNPRSFIRGSGTFTRYLGALVEENLVVLENLDYGNAVYVMYEDWETLSQLSRTQLLAERTERRFSRFPHLVGWEQRVRDHIGQRRRQTDPPEILV